MDGFPNIEIALTAEAETRFRAWCGENFPDLGNPVEIADDFRTDASGNTYRAWMGSVKYAEDVLDFLDAEPSGTHLACVFDPADADFMGRNGKVSWHGAWHDNPFIPRRVEVGLSEGMAADLADILENAFGRAKALEILSNTLRIVEAKDESPTA